VAHGTFPRYDRLLRAVRSGKPTTKTPAKD
jgi:hypothetical protein